MGVSYPTPQMQRLRPTKLTSPVRVIQKGKRRGGCSRVPLVWESLKHENRRPTGAAAGTLSRHCPPPLLRAPRWGLSVPPPGACRTCPPRKARGRAGIEGGSQGVVATGWELESLVRWGRPATKNTTGGRDQDCWHVWELWGVPQQGEGPKDRARARSGSCGLPRPARVTASIGGVPNTSREPRDQGQGAPGAAGDLGTEQGCGALKAFLASTLS